MNLYRLEMMKIRISTYLKAALGICAGLWCLGILFLFIFLLESPADPESVELFSQWDGLFALISALTFSTHSVFAACLSSGIIIGEYFGKNAPVLLTFPIQRKSVLHKKCVIICTVTIAAAFFCNVTTMGMMYIASKLFRITPQMLTKHFFLTVFLASILTGAAASALGIISCLAGWQKQSQTATVIASLVIICFITNWIALFPCYIVPVMLLMSIVLAAIAVMIYNILTKKLENLEV